MKKPSLVHGAWCVAAIASFVLGSQLFPAGSGSSDVGSDAANAPTRSGSMRSSARDGGSSALAGPAEKRHRDGRSLSDGEAGVPPRPVLSEQEIEALGEQFQHSPNPVERRLAFSRLLEALTPENARMMREQVAHLDDNSAEFREFHYAWGAIAGAEAVMHGADTKKTDMAATLAGWAGADPDAAISWFESYRQEGDNNGSNLIVGMVHGLGNADPELATRFVLDQAAAGDGKADWMIGIVAGKVIGAEGPAGAATWAQDLPPGSVRANALNQVARDYARNDPRATVAWLESIPASGDTSRGMQSAFSTWAERDPATAGQHLNQMPASADRDWAVSGYAPRVAHEDAASGLQWVESINDPGVREQTLIRTAQVFYHHGDKQEVREWLPGSGLSPEAQQQVLRGRGRRR